ncbi:MAG TPA: lipoprotein-releasing system ATP-binding protein LolD [Crocinitomicaceae bacterium]|nr:ABC transporter ATP-binding protein [Flavobacteriales bacterium]HBW86901.1 lipoprotein-releasing system ATP-binding protein LolD [Crocinitomicaceae bacterium]
MLIAQNITKSYGELAILKGVNLRVEKSEIVSIVGSSGAGKTTLLQILGTLDKPDGGEIIINGISPFSLNQSAIAAFRNKHIGFIFQFHQLLPEFTAIENVMIPGMIAGTNKKQLQERAEMLLSKLSIDHRKNHKPSELSGGEQQRIAVCRALINEPSIVLADEPSGNLDTKNAKELHELFFKLREEFQQTFVIVTHNEDLANMADRKLTMKDGLFV